MNPVGQPRRARKLEFNRRGQGGNEMVMMTTWSVIHRARAAPSVHPSVRPRPCPPNSGQRRGRPRLWTIAPVLISHTFRLARTGQTDGLCGRARSKATACSHSIGEGNVRYLELPKKECQKYGTKKFSLSRVLGIIMSGFA